MVDAPDTVNAVLDAMTAQLRAGGRKDARSEALLLARAMVPATTFLDPDAALDPGAVAALLDAGRRRASGEPSAHATGSMGFRHLVLRSDSRALIPRPETEGLVEAALGKVRQGVATDVGTGTGAIALSLRQEGTFDRVIGIDLSPDALALARRNGDLTGLDVSWIEGDLLSPLGDASVDLLVSNPPYLTAQEYATLDPSVRDYEPAMALVSGEDGLDATRRLLTDGRRVVRPGGWIVLEIDCRRDAASVAIARSNGWQDVAVQDDLFGRARYLLARQGDMT